jgi:hypothetical protein
MTADAPERLIPYLRPGSPPVPTEGGLLRPERSILYNRPFLLLHHYGPAHTVGPGGSRPTIGRLELEACKRTAKRLDAILRPHWSEQFQFLPLWWPAPERITFYAGIAGTPDADVLPQLHQLASRGLQSGERLELRTLASIEALEYRRL